RGPASHAHPRAAKHRPDVARGRPHFHPAAVGDAAPYCQSLHLPPRPDRIQAEAVRDRTTEHRLLLLGDRAGSPGGMTGLGYGLWSWPGRTIRSSRLPPPRSSLWRWQLLSRSASEVPIWRSGSILLWPDQRYDIHRIAVRGWWRPALDRFRFPISRRRS